jgi:hypothetical protein
MAKRQIRFSALGFLLLFAATLIESGLHTFVHHGDSHLENAAALHSCHHHPADTTTPDFSFENSEADCALCAHLLSYQHFSLQQYSNGLVPCFKQPIICFEVQFAGNTEIPQRPLRGPPAA